MFFEKKLFSSVRAILHISEGRGGGGGGEGKEGRDEERGRYGG